MTECNICCINMNKCTRKEVNCPYCDFSFCLSCFRKYLMNNSKPVADCMSCHREFNIDFVSEITPKIFYNKEYRNKRAKDLLSQERSLLPDTQYLVEEQKERDKKREQIDKLNRELKILKEHSRKIRNQIYSLRYVSTPQYLQKKERKKFIMSCPAKDCRGFLSQAWKCGTCEIYVCHECREIKNGREDLEHVCNKDSVATAKLLAKETKPCPKCAVLIYKISGCDQMWCVECKTPFSWKSGNVITGIIHNPHFYQWQRDQNNGVAPRVPGDGPCGGACGNLPWPNVIANILKTRKQTFSGWEKCHQLIGHTRDIEMHRYPALIGMEDNTDLRLSFLTKKINETKWLKILKMRQKKIEKNRAINQVLELFYVSATDIFNTYITGHEKVKRLDIPLKELRLYVNEELMKIKKKYTIKIPYITLSWKIVSK